jgi:sensor histidine kinase YesM
MAGFAAGLLAWLLVEVVLNIRYRYFELFSEPSNYVYSSLFGWAILELTYLSGRVIDRRWPWAGNPARRWLLQTLASAALILFVVGGLRLLFNLLIIPGKLVILSDEAVILAISISLVILFNLTELGFFLNERYRASLAEAERYRKENAEYQFEMLKLQLNPHFLFNSLNTLSSLVYEDRDKAGEFIRKLSDVYRYVLDNRNRELVSLAEEIGFIRSFCYLLGLRFQGMIGFEFILEENSMERKIAPMTLQLLVENAVKHNVASRSQPLTVTVRSENDTVSVTNNLRPKPGQAGTGVGLKNIASRYAFLTERKIDILNDDHIFEVKIPLI